jgi:hypothetical protein
MDQVSIKYTSIFHRKTLQNLPKFGFLVRKQTIWQPWSSSFSLSPVWWLPDGFFTNPKIPIWANFGGPEVGKCWCIIRPFGILYDHWGNLMIIWYIFSSLGITHQEKSGNPGSMVAWFKEALRSVYTKQVFWVARHKIWSYGANWKASVCVVNMSQIWLHITKFVFFV